MDLSKLSNDELLAIVNGGAAAPADAPAAGAGEVADRPRGSAAGMSDQELLGLTQQPSGGGVLNGAGRGFTQGATLGFADEIYGAGGGVKSWLNGKGFQEGYQRARDAYRGDDKAAEEAHPYASLAGKVAGNVAGLAPVAGSAPKLLGLGAKTLVGKVGGGMAAGAGWGAVQGLGEGEGGALDQAASVALGAGGGGLLGAAAPVAGQMIGKAVAPIAQRIVDGRIPVPGMGNAAARMAAEDLERAGGRAAVDARLAELGPEARLYDGAPSFEGSGQGLAVRPETRDIIVNDARARRAGQLERLRGDVDEVLPPSPVPDEVRQGFRDWQDRLLPGYQMAEATTPDMPAHAAGRLWDLAEHLAAQQKGQGQGLLAQAVEAIAPTVEIPGRGRVRVPDTSIEGLMESRRVLDGLLARVEESAQLQTEGVGRRLGMLRQAVDDQVRAMNPRIKDLDRGFQAAAQSREAFDRGQNFMARDVHPQELRTRLEAAPMEEQAAERLGARSRIDREMGNTNRDLVTLRNVVQTEGKWNHEKLAAYFGEEAAGRIMAATDREAAFEQTARRLVDNSQTAQRLESAARYEPRGEKAADPSMAIAGGAGGFKGAAIAALVKGAKGANLEAQRLADVDRNGEVARLLVQRPGPELDRQLTQLQRRVDLRGVGDAAGGRAGRVAQVLLAAQGNEGAQRLRQALER